jgi:ABC-type transport system involved in cytochrome c biogenesis permease component
VLWVAYLFSGVLVLKRRWPSNAMTRLSALLMALIDRGVIYLAKLLGNPC